MLFGIDTKILFTLIAFATIAVAMVPYARDIFKRRTRPHLYTWLIWSVTGGIATAGLIYGGGGYPVISSGFGTALCIFVFLASFKYGTKDVTVSDTIALGIAGAAVFAWVVLNNPLASVILGISVDLIGYYPTFRKSYADPWGESLSSWILWTAVPLFSVLGLGAYNVFTLINYTPIGVVNIIFLTFMLLRRRVVPKPRAGVSTALVVPDVRFKESYIAALAEYHEEARFLDDDIEKISADFSAFVEKEKGKARGEHLPEGYVPETRFWLVSGDEYLGDLGIRHRLTDHLMAIGGHIGYAIRPSKRKQGYGKHILKLGLEKAKEMGFEKVLLTCDVNNLGSRKIIEGNGGVFENQIENPGHPDKARFWIKI